MFFAALIITSLLIAGLADNFLGLAAVACMLVACAVRTDEANVAALVAMEEKCRLLSDTAQVFILHASQVGLITYVNGYAERVTGYSRDELMGMNAFELFIPPQNRDEVVSEIIAVMSGQPVTSFETPILDRQGNEHHFLWSAARTTGTTNITTGFVVSGIDITELKHTQDELKDSEEKYRTLVEHSLAAIFIIQNDKIVFANRRAEELIGYKLNEVKDMDAWRIVHPDDRQVVADRAYKILHGEEVPEQYEYRLVMRSGDIRNVVVWATAMKYDKRPAVLLDIIDITDLRKAQEARMQAELELERHKQLFYRQTITALTRGKLEVLDPVAISHVLKNVSFVMPLRDNRDVPDVRQRIKEFSRSNGLQGDRLSSFLLAVGEAMTNVLKHAGVGDVYVGIHNDAVWVGVVDRGAGMDTFILTHALFFTKGFSTKPSLGLGYTLILEGSDHVFLATSSKGTTVIMEKDVREPKESAMDLARFPTIW